MVSSFEPSHPSNEEIEQIMDPSANTGRFRASAIPPHFGNEESSFKRENERKNVFWTACESTRNTHNIRNDPFTSHADPEQHMTAGASARYQNPSTLDAQNSYLQKVIEELRQSNSKQIEIITELKIKVAVLENDLSYARQDKDLARNSLGLVIDTFSRAPFNSPPSTSGVARLEDHASRGVIENNIQALKDAEREIEDLRKQNKRQSRALKSINESRNRGRSPSPVRLNNLRTPTRQTGDPHSLLSGNEKKVSFHMNNWNQTSHRINPNDPPPFLDSCKTEDSFQNSPLEHQLPQEESFATASTTYPNTPISPTQLEPNIQDEFTPIDELFYSSTDEDAVEEKKKRDKYFNPPPPGVLKTGIVSSGKYVGDDTQFIPSGKAPWNKWGGAARPDGCLENPYAPPTLQKHTSGLLNDSANSSFEKSSDNSVWTSLGERQVAIQIHQKACSYEHRLPDVFKYGLQYIPSATDPNYTPETNYNRSVLITNLPHNTQLRDVLAVIRGGEILSSVLCNTVPLIDSMTVRLVFKLSSAAITFIQNCESYPLVFFPDTSPLPLTAIAALIPTPTYPTNHTRLNEQSRCLRIPNFPRHLSVCELQSDIACNSALRADNLLEIWIAKDRALNMQFSSIDAAGNTLGFVNTRAKYRDHGVKATFWDDPCSLAVGENEEEEVGMGIGRMWSKPSFVLKGKGKERELFDQQRLITHETQKNESQPQTQRKQLLALSIQKISIPTLDGKSISGSNWADEVNEEQESISNQTSSPNKSVVYSPLPGITDYEKLSRKPLSPNPKEKALSYDDIDLDINRLMADKNHKIWKDRKPPTGLAGSKYATLVPEFEDRDRVRRSSKSSASGERAQRGGSAEEGGIKLHIHHARVISSSEEEQQAKFNPINYSVSTSSSPSESDSGMGKKHHGKGDAREGMEEADYMDQINLERLIASSPSESAPEPESPANSNSTTSDDASSTCAQMANSPPPQLSADSPLIPPFRSQDAFTKGKVPEGVIPEMEIDEDLALALRMSMADERERERNSALGGSVGRGESVREGESGLVNWKMRLPSQTVACSESATVRGRFAATLSSVGDEREVKDQEGGEEGGQEGKNPDEITLDLDSESELELESCSGSELEEGEIRED